MILPLVSLLLPLTAGVFAHSTHHVEQESFSQEHLEELERKWGTDVSGPSIQILILLLTCQSGDSLASRHSLICLTSAASRILKLSSILESLGLRLIRR